MQLETKVKVTKFGSPGSLYLLIPSDVASKLRLKTGDGLLLFLDEEGHLIYEPKKPPVNGEPGPKEV